MNNFEKIKLMNIDELSIVFYELLDNKCTMCIYHWTTRCDSERCEIGIKKWLENEVIE